MWFGSFLWSMLLIYDASKFKTPVTSWADFWNVTTFPGKRSLRKTAKFTMEIALLADGVKREDVYRVLATPEGVERVFKNWINLNRISSGGNLGRNRCNGWCPVML